MGLTPLSPASTTNTVSLRTQKDEEVSIVKFDNELNVTKNCKLRVLQRV